MTFWQPRGSFVTGEIHFLAHADVVSANASVSHSSEQYGLPHIINLFCLRAGGGLLRKRKGELGQICVRHRVLWLEDCEETRGLWPLRFPQGLHDGLRASLGANHADRFWAAPHSAVWKSVLLPRQQRERLFKRNILSFSLIHCSWRFRTLLLNCSCYSYQHLYQQLSACIQRLLPPLLPPTPNLVLLGDSVLLLHSQYEACKCALLSSLCRSSQPEIIFLWNLYLLFRTKRGVLFLHVMCPWRPPTSESRVLRSLFIRSHPGR